LIDQNNSIAGVERCSARYIIDNANIRHPHRILAALPTSLTYTTTDDNIKEHPAQNIANRTDIIGTNSIDNPTVTPVIIIKRNNITYDIAKVIRLTVTLDKTIISLAIAIFVIIRELLTRHELLPGTLEIKKVKANIPVDMYTQ
jgi:hypothetical protein